MCAENVFALPYILFIILAKSSKQFITDELYGTGQEIKQLYPHKMENCLWTSSDICKKYTIYCTLIESYCFALFNIFYLPNGSIRTFAEVTDDILSLGGLISLQTTSVL